MRSVRRYVREEERFCARRPVERDGEKFRQEVVVVRDVRRILGEREEDGPEGREALVDGQALFATQGAVARVVFFVAREVDERQFSGGVEVDLERELDEEVRATACVVIDRGRRLTMTLANGPVLEELLESL